MLTIRDAVLDTTGTPPPAQVYCLDQALRDAAIDWPLELVRGADGALEMLDLVMLHVSTGLTRATRKAVTKQPTLLDEVFAAITSSTRRQAIIITSGAE